MICAGRLADRVQLTSDCWNAYSFVVDKALGNDIDYARLQKIYDPRRAENTELK